MTSSEDILSIRDFSVRFAQFEGSSHVLNGVNLTVRRGERVALVGELACGKTLTARSVIGLADLRRAEVSGDVSVFGKNVLDFRDKDWRGIRGNRLTMIFQDPFAALNPVFSIADQLTTVILRGNRARTPHRGDADRARRARHPSALWIRIGCSDPIRSSSAAA